jgi:adenosine deaminase/aminodeoxyfutalosine deaminase
MDVPSQVPGHDPGQFPMHFEERPELRTFLRRLPKAELHLHLEGTVTPETLVALSERHAAENPETPLLTLDEARSLYRYTDFTGFLLAFKAISARLIDAADYEFITWRMAEQLAAQGVVHAEVYISIGVIYYWRRAEAAENPFLIESIFDGMERARRRAELELGLSIYWIFDAVRHFGVEEAAVVFRQAAKMRGDHASIVGIGIGGDERRGSAELFRDLYAEARDAGLHLTAHGGETSGPESIWAALNIGAERIGHGLTAQFDPELMELLAERQVPIEICVTSNLRTASCRSILEHPVRRYFDQGLMVTLNSDDPALFGSNLLGEYALAHQAFDFTEEHLRELAANSFEASFLPPVTKVSWLRSVATFEASSSLS